MKRPLIFLIFLLTATPLLAISQLHQKADSIKKILPNLTGERKLKAYEDLVNETEWNLDTKSVLNICDEWIQYAGKEGNLKFEEAARTKKLTVIYNTENWLLLVDEAQKQKAWMEQHKLWNSFYKSWRDMAESYSYSGRPQTALREAQKMMEHAQENDNDLGRALAYQQMGIIYDNIDSKESAKAFERSISLLKNIPEISGNELLSGYFYLCQALDQIGDYDHELTACAQWRDQLRKTEQTEKVEKGRMDVHYLEYHLWNASALIGLNRLDEAEAELQQCEQFNQTIQDPYLVYQTQVHRASHALKQGNLKAAESYSDRFAPMMDIDLWPFAKRLRGEILLKAGRNREAALLYQKMYQQKDSTFSKDVRMQLDEFNTLFQVNELRMKSQLERSRFTIIIVVLIVVALLIFILLRHRAANRLRQKNEELTIANIRAEESSRMKTNFIQQISHEIRTPLNILNGFTQVITDPDIELQNEEKADIQQRISESTERITGLINKMLELSDASSQTVIERSDETSAVIIATQAASDSGIQQAQHITFSLHDNQKAGDIVLRTNQQYAVRALSLLLDNAGKFTESGEVRLCLESATDSVAFIVEDTGIGIPPDKADAIFEEFVQLDDYYDGTGIGLTIARSIARRLQGDITLDTSYADGARFIMTLPL